MSEQEYLEDTIKTLGERYGYGNIMEVASELWRYDLMDKRIPVSGAFVPVIITRNEFGEDLCLMNGDEYKLEKRIY